MKLDDPLIGGIVIGISLGLYFGASLHTFFPFFAILGGLYLLRYVTAK